MTRIIAWFFLGMTVADHVAISGREVVGPFSLQEQCVGAGDQWAAARPGRVFANRERFYDDALAIFHSGSIPTTGTPDPRAGHP